MIDVETIIADSTIKDSTYVWHDRLHLFLFPSDKLEKHNYLKLVSLHPEYCLYLYLESILCIYNTKNKEYQEQRTLTL